MQPFKPSQAQLIALATAAIGQLVAFLPAFAPDKQILISAATTVIAAVFLIANAVHALAASKVTVSDVQSAGEAAAKQALAKVDLNALAQQAIDGRLSAGSLEATVRGEIQKLLAGAVQAAPGVLPVSRSTSPEQAASASPPAA